MMTTADCCQREVATIPAQALVREAADAMKARGVGSLIVLRDGAPVGIVTDRDLLERVVAVGKDAGATAIAEVMSAPLQVAALEDPLEDIIERMAAQGIRRVPIVGDGALVGIVALDDVLVDVAGALHNLAEGTRRELHVAQSKARAAEITRDLGERLRELGEQLDHLGGEARNLLAREIEHARERLRSRKH